jgi:transposase-like protein
VSALAESLDAIGEQFGPRPLDAGPYTYLWIDALVVKCREDGCIVNIAAMIATAINREGRREISLAQTRVRSPKMAPDLRFFRSGRLFPCVMLGVCWEQTEPKP